ncbi:MAG: PLP-dependent aminotransferase family protein [Candidatus Thermoplasmatota archaeon]|nr:PLP-dependent aminotransferase family protein [Candidatus Thermoplasmatota archaeon]MCL5963713.1 PLP-dependent aminotransferase family protein [Candidatus Thermoplasmatota archaeon]
MLDNTNKPAFAKRTERMKASEIRELLKLTQNPEVISFAGGLPNPASFPVEIINKISSDVLTTIGETALQYGTTEGVIELRETLNTYMKKNGIITDVENILITTGSQQGLDLVGKVLVDPDDVVIASAPSYLGALSVFKSYGADIIQIPMKEDGIDLDIMDHTIKKIKNEGKFIKLIYTNPTYHNPTGVSMNTENRKKMYDIARDHGIFILEDDPYRELSYFKESELSVKSFDKTEHVIYMSTFSKILSPGFRLGWITGMSEVIRKIAIAKQAIDLCSNTLTQYIAYYYISKGYAEKHIPKIRTMYKEKLEIIINALNKFMPDYVSWTNPKGGMFIWLTLPNNINVNDMFPYAISNNIAYVTGTAFYIDGKSGMHSMRLNFTYPSNNKIVEGIENLSKVIKKWNSKTYVESNNTLDSKERGKELGLILK